MKTPEWLLHQVRLCRYSRIQCDAKDLMPDYACDKSGKDCVLLMTEEDCRKREEFPEILND